MLAYHGVGLIQIVVPAAAALIGVLIGGWITSHNQKKERRNRRIREQLEGFYGPLLAMRMKIRAMSEVREKLRNIARAAYNEELKAVGPDPVVKANYEATHWPEYVKLIEYDERQLKEELVPIYRKMLELMTDKMWLAEQATLDHYAGFVEFVEIWNRALDKSMPSKVVWRIEHSEASLQPFYDNLASQAEQFRLDLRG